ncbi:SNF2 family N-terminal domain-containing protein [Mycena capillaripes]|nr:SNF2 family N-terminal domain-containing protein [Mycena capillaripes]
MTANERPPLFFAGSDDEDETEDVLMELADAGPSSSRASSTSRLFSEDGSGDEKDTESAAAGPQKRPIFVDDDSDPEIQSVPPQTSVKVEDAAKAGPSRKSAQKASAPPAKKRRISPTASSEFPPTFIGEMVFAHAWSNVSGKGYIKNNEQVKIMREPQEPKKSGSNKTDTKNKKTGDGKKQMSLTAMLKQPAKNNNKKTDNIVRLYNSRGFEFGRLPQDVSSWMAKLLDLGIVEFRGKMMDCPEKLSTGATLIITADVYMLHAAFTASKSAGDDRPTVMFSEGVETLDEQMLRERKASILKLFDVLNLRPQAGANFTGRKSDEEIHEEAMKKISQRTKPKKVTEIVGDGEEIEVEEGEELTENDLDMIYHKAQKGDRTMGEMEPPSTFTFTLRGYQKQALLWMHSLELGKMDAREAASMHPLWSQYAFPHPRDGEVIDLTAEEKPFYFNPYSGELSLEFPKAERKGRGGILAFKLTSSPVGKTIELAALIHTNCAPDTERPAEDPAPPPGTKHRQMKLNHAFKKAPRRKTQPAPSATLIVAPTSLLSQWEGELQRCSKPGTLKVILWHGQNRLDLEDVLEDDDDDDGDAIKVVITSYGVLASEHAKSEKSSSKSPVFESKYCSQLQEINAKIWISVEWLRVVLDEAHSCKSRSSKTAKAVYALHARRRWAVTGTPIVNKLEDLYSLLKFLDFQPWSDFSFFRSFITLPFLARDPKAIEIVQIILESILLRREKTMLDTNGKRIVELPQKEVTVEYLEFSSLERKIYNSLFNSAKRDFQRLDAKGLIGKNYTHILAMLMRLRRAVLHPNLVLSSDDERSLPKDGEGTVDVNELIKRFANDEDTGEGSSNVFAQNALKDLQLDEADAECPMCMDVMQSPMIIPECMHRCCKDCIVTYCANVEERGEEPRCPTCSRGPFKASFLASLLGLSDESDLIEVFRPPKSSQDPQPDVILRKNDFHSSTKLDALIQNLRKLREQDPCFRAVVFSQFTSFLDLIQAVLKRERFEQYRFDGSMDVKKRGAALDEFRAPTRKPKVLVVSLKAGGVGLNLTTANHVFMMDCWWNAATENQAIDRVHRIGQEKTVYVKHFIVSNTIEGRILRIQKRKTAIVKEAFRGGGGAAGTDPESIENLKIMFGEEENDG